MRKVVMQVSDCSKSCLNQLSSGESCSATKLPDRLRLGVPKTAKTLLLFLLSVFFVFSAEAKSQTITLSGKNMAFRDIFLAIENQTGFLAVGNQDILTSLRPVTISVSKMPLGKFLDVILKGQSVVYQIEGKNIILFRKNSKSFLPIVGDSPSIVIQQEDQAEVINGRVVDSAGAPLSKASVVVKGKKIQTVTDKDGYFSIAAQAGDVLTISFVGYKTVMVTVGADLAPVIRMLPDVQAIETVNIGVVRRNVNTFTGATTTFNTEQLMKSGNLNPLQSLKNLDPSFNVFDNIQFGANPNTLPNIELQGISSISSDQLRNTYGGNPNLPLFILDGFESDLRTISDLNVNRIARITLLKDAASTAIYGSRAANGVVVVETVQPKGGKLELRYTSDISAEFPFLDDYNLMDAKEKYEFEKMTGTVFYDFNDIGNYEYYTREILSREENIKRGVNTYWLSEPVRAAISSRHNLNISGGSENFIFNAGLNYGRINGIMKESYRNTWRGTISVTYRKDKLSVNNQLWLEGFDANESPYGSFAAFALANPYYEKINPNGTVPRRLVFPGGTSRTEPPINPLYAASLNNIDRTKMSGFVNNTQLVYNLTNALRLTGGISVSTMRPDRIRFSPPEHPSYDNVDFTRRGLYQNFTTKQFSLQGFAGASYARIFNGVHNFTSNFRAEVQESSREDLGFMVTGFPLGTGPNPALAYGYVPGTIPSQAKSKFRRNNILVSFNYSYDGRYLFDFTYRYDGSTAFGSAKKYSPFWSVGAGINLHQEAYFKDISWINLLRVRGNIGKTGNQGFGTVLSDNIYSAAPEANRFGQVLQLSTIGTPDLDWQKTLQTTVGADFALFGNRVTGWANYFVKNTSPLIIFEQTAPSVGVPSIPTNVGKLVYKGFDFLVSYSPIYHPEQDIVWTIGFGGSRGSSTVSFSEEDKQRLSGVNRRQQTPGATYSPVRYVDGHSTEDIWAVQSGGIDPATGKEIFIRRENGIYSFNYYQSDEVVVGNTRPDLRGTVSSTLSYKGFSVTLFCSYTFGGDILNTTLYNKVENLPSMGISPFVLYNLDRRALYDTWGQSGDVKAFRRIGSPALDRYAPPTSRFVQTENMFRADNISIGYRWMKRRWLDKLGIQEFKVAAYTANLFAISSIYREKGIEYPFSKSYSLNFNITF